MESTNNIKQISVHTLKDMLDSKKGFQLLDVREIEELQIAKLEHHIHIPMEELIHRYKELDHKMLIVIMCHRGGRSMLASQFLQKKGFTVANLQGGIDAWSKQINPKVNMY